MNAATLIVAHNTREDLRACLRSLVKSGAPSDSVYVADNASADGTPEMLAAEFPHVHLVRYDANVFYADAVNALAAVSNSEWMLLLNPDVLCRYDELVALCDRWHDQHGVAAVAPQLRYFDGRIQPSCRRLPDALTVWREFGSALWRKPSLWKMADFDHRLARAVPQPMFSCIWIRRRAWEAAGELDSRYPLFFNDVDWCRRALALGWEIQFDPGVAVLHKYGGTTTRYPMRKLCHSSWSLGRYLWHSSPSLSLSAVGLLGVVISFVGRLPLALARSNIGSPTDP